MSAGEPVLPPRANAVCEGGDLDCGSGLLLIIRRAMKPLDDGGVLEVRSREISVREDLPAWCRMVGHDLPAVIPAGGGSTSYFVRKGGPGDSALEADLETARNFTWAVRVRWTGGMGAKAWARNHTIEVGQPASLDVEDPAPSAVELLLSSLGGCLAVGFQWRASRGGIEVNHLEVTLEAQLENLLVFLGMEDDGTPALRWVRGTLYVDADADPEDLEALWEETVRRSPVARSLIGEVPLELSVRIT